MTQLRKLSKDVEDDRKVKWTKSQQTGRLVIILWSGMLRVAVK